MLPQIRSIVFSRYI